MIDICEHLEGVARQLVEENGLKSGGGGAGGGAPVRWGRSEVMCGVQVNGGEAGMSETQIRVGFKSGRDGA